MPERVPSLEFTEAERVLIQKLCERGPDDPETRQLLNFWTEQCEAEANEVNTPRANVEFNIKRAKLYRAAGLMVEAWDVLESAREQAMNEQEQDLYDEAVRIMDEIGLEAGQ